MMRNKDTYPLQPPRERGTGRALALAVVMHVLLGLFLYHGIRWQNSTPAGEEAELWTEVPDLSTPRPLPPPAPVAPAPPPPQTEEADIALQQLKRKQQEAAREAQLAEQQRLKAQQEADAKRQQQLAAQQAAQLALQQKQAKLKQEQQQATAEKLKQQDALKKQAQEDAQKQAKLDAQKKADAEKAAKAKAQADAQAKKLDAERRARIAQMQGSMGGGAGTSGNGLAKSGTGSGSGGNAASPGYADKVRRRVRPNIIWAGETAGLETEISVHCSPSGTLLSANISRSSGNSQWDDAALRAVQRSDPMPQDTDGKTPSNFKITLRPAS